MHGDKGEKREENHILAPQLSFSEVDAISSYLCLSPSSYYSEN